MIEIQIPKDIRKYEAKVVSFLTLRGLICAVFMAACAALAYFFMKYVFKMESIENMLPVFLIFMTPGALFGWVKPNGLPFEMFLYYMFYTIFLTPKHRVHKIENSFENVLKDIDKEEKALKEQKELLLHHKKKKKKSKPSTLAKPRLKPNKNPDFYGFI